MFKADFKLGTIVPINISKKTGNRAYDEFGKMHWVQTKTSILVSTKEEARAWIYSKLMEEARSLHDQMESIRAIIGSFKSETDNEPFPGDVQ